MLNKGTLSNSNCYKSALRSSLLISEWLSDIFQCRLFLKRRFSGACHHGNSEIWSGRLLNNWYCVVVRCWSHFNRDIHIFMKEELHWFRTILQIWEPSRTQNINYWFATICTIWTDLCTFNGWLLFLRKIFGWK